MPHLNCKIRPKLPRMSSSLRSKCRRVRSRPFNPATSLKPARNNSKRLRPRLTPSRKRNGASLRTSLISTDSSPPVPMIDLPLTFPQSLRNNQNKIVRLKLASHLSNKPRRRRSRSRSQKQRQKVRQPTIIISLKLLRSNLKRLRRPR